MKYLYFFFYGTLMKEYKDGLRKDAEYIKTITLPYRMYITPYGYPVITHEEGITKGEIYRVITEDESSLDKYEDYYSKYNSRNAYNRECIKYKDIDLNIYFASERTERIAKDYDIVVADGDWLNFEKKKHSFKYFINNTEYNKSKD